MIYKKFEKIINKLGKNRVLVNERLNRYVSFRIGGPADLLFKALSTQDIINAVQVAKYYQIPYIIIGGGTNILVGDKGFRGLVIKNETSKIQTIGIRVKKLRNGGSDIKIEEKDVYIEAESGVSLNRLVRYTIDQGLSGLEAFLGQPGTIGGALYINAHNMRLSSFLGDSLVAGQLLNVDGKKLQVDKSYFHFGYDYSLIQKTHDIILSATFRLRACDKNLAWKKAQEAFYYRQKTQPSGVYSAGCIFRNIEKSQAIRLATPQFTCSAGYLLDVLGFKGKKFNNAQYSDRHANFIVHTGDAKAMDVLELINQAKKSVKEKYGINFKEEIIYIGDF